MQVSYAKGMDWYLMTSFLFIFLTLVECIVVEKLWRKKVTKKKITDEKKANEAQANQVRILLRQF